MISQRLLRWGERLRHGTDGVIDCLLIAPCRGLTGIVHGLTLAVPLLLTAAWDALGSHLSPTGRTQVCAGLDRLLDGWAQVRWHLVCGVLVVRLGWYGLTLCVMGALLGSVC